MKKTLLFVLGIVLAAGLTAGYRSVEADSQMYKVEIGESASAAKNAHSHDLSQEALKEGRKEYTVAASSEASYKISLTQQQIEDILGGTTVIVETAQGGMKVKIGPAEKKAKKSGW
ncbi:MAG: hypothetical protein V3T83_11750 [Acidobacteriota bacterium]